MSANVSRIIHHPFIVLTYSLFRISRPVSSRRYAGEFIDGLRQGRGTYKFANRTIYNGYWEDDKRHGKGTCKFASGNVYEGDWVADKRCGLGVLQFKDGSEYSGGFKNDKRRKCTLQNSHSTSL